MEDIVVLRIVNGSDLFCIFNAVVDETAVANAKANYRKTRKFENPILSTASDKAAAKLRALPPPPPVPSESLTKPSTSKDNDSDDEDQDDLALESIYHH